MRRTLPLSSTRHAPSLSAARTLQLLDGLASVLRFAFRAAFIAVLVIGVVG